MSSIKINSWVLFTNRVRTLLKANGYTGADVATKANQFCSYCKTQRKDYAAFTDKELLDMRSTWEAPEVSKQAAAGHHFKNKQRLPNLVKEAAAEAGDEEAAAWVERYYARQHVKVVKKQEETDERHAEIVQECQDNVKQLMNTIAGIQALAATLPPDAGEGHPIAVVIMGMIESMRITSLKTAKLLDQRLTLLENA